MFPQSTVFLLFVASLIAEMILNLKGAGLLGHDGGWDEFLMVAVPVIIFALLLRLASKRADKIGEPEDHKEPREI